MTAETYPILDIFWTMFEIFAFVVWIWLLIVIFSDIFRSHDIGGFAKAMWFLFVLFLPLIGILFYLIVRGGGMHERAAAQVKAQQEAFDQYVKSVADNGNSSSADQLAKLADLHSKGVLNDQEFEAQKAKILS